MVKNLKLQYHSISPQSKTHLKRLNCKHSKTFKCCIITLPCSFRFTRKFRDYLIPKGVPVYQEKAIFRSISFLVNYDWRVDIPLEITSGELFFKGVYIYGDTGIVDVPPFCHRRIDQSVYRCLLTISSVDLNLPFTYLLLHFCCHFFNVWSFLSVSSAGYLQPRTI